MLYNQYLIYPLFITVFLIFLLVIAIYYAYKSKQNRYLFEQNPLPMLVYELGTLRMLTVNHAFTTHYGYSKDEALSLYLTDLYPEYEKKGIADLTTKLKGHAYAGEWHHIKKDGTIMAIDAHSHQFSYKGRSSRIAVITDITERKKAEERLRHSEEQFRLISENVSDMISVFDLNAKRIYSSPSYKPLLGEIESLYGSDLFTEIIPEDREMIKSMFNQLIKTGEGVRSEYRIIALDGSIHFIESQGNIIRNEQGEITNVVFVSRDFTDRKSEEEKILHYYQLLEDKVKERTEQLEIEKERAESADRTKSAFLATMSHELRTPLNSIIGFTGILLKGLAGPLNSEQIKQLGMAKGSAHHLLDLINDVLDISKIEAGEFVVSIRQFNLNEALQKIVSTVRPLAEKKGLDLCLSVSDDVQEINSDERRVLQIMLNLINNAIKFSEHGVIKIDCIKNDDTIITKVIDTGIGISRQDLDKLFKPFSQVETGITRNHEGTGLGLSISKRLAEKLNGTISVESELGAGSIFTLTLPINQHG